MNPPLEDSSAPQGPWPWGWPPGNRPDEAPPRAEGPSDWAEAPPPAPEPEPEPTPEPSPEPEPDFGRPSTEPAAAAAAPPLDTANPRFWAVACHLSGLIPLVVGLPFLGPIAPLILWRTKRDEFASADFHGREALNFQLNILFWTLVPAITCIGAPLALVALAANVVLSIVAAVSASNGEAYRYPGIYRAVDKDGERASGRVA